MTSAAGAAFAGPSPAVAAAGRDLGLCVRCGRLVCDLAAVERGELPGRGTVFSLHHRILGNRADNRLSNLVTLCGHGSAGCHYEVHGPGRAEAEACGWVVSRYGDPGDTARVPVLYAQRPICRAGRFVLDDSGGLELAA